jgi:hypothetical protein
MARDSSVGIEANYALDEWGYVPSRGIYFSLLHCFQASCGAYPALYQTGVVGFRMGLNSRNINLAPHINIEPISRRIKLGNTIILDETLCGSCKKRRFGATYRLHHQGDKNRRARKVSSN